MPGEKGGHGGRIGGDKRLKVDLTEVVKFLRRKIRCAGMGGDEGFHEVGKLRLIRRRKAGFGRMEKGFEAGVHGGRIAGERREGK